MVPNFSAHFNCAHLLVFCLKSAVDTLEKSVKQKDVIDVKLVYLLLTRNIHGFW